MALATPAMDAATDKDPQSIWQATTTAMNAVNPLGKLERIGKALTPDIAPAAPLTPETPTPTADVLTPAVQLSNKPNVDATWGDLTRPDVVFEGVHPSQFTPGQWGRFGEAQVRPQHRPAR